MSEVTGNAGTEDVAAENATGAPDDAKLAGNPIVNEAHKRYKRCMDWEADYRKKALDDDKFANADDSNGWQWPNDLRRNRDVDARPSLTINRIRQHNLQILNDMRQNKPGIKVTPTGGGATYDAAQILQSIVRQIEYESKAEQAYMTAANAQVLVGCGYFRISTEYENETSFNQCIRITRVPNRESIYLDPDIKEFDGRDARFGFVFDDIPRAEFIKDYPQFAKYATHSVLGNTGDEWINDDTVRMAEYFRLMDEDDTIYMVPAVGDKPETVVRKSEVPPEMAAALEAQPEVRKRPTTNTKCEWYLIVGEEIADQKEWPGKYIPIVRVIGDETVIEKILDRKGHTRAMRDPQRMYNYWTSSAAEQVALQTKTPWVGPKKAFEGLEAYWNTANTKNTAYLPFNHIDDEGNPIAAPARPQPPTMATAYIEGMRIAGQELMDVSGQHEPLMGQPGNERATGAVMARQRRGEIPTFHFVDNLAIAIAFAGEIILDLIPKIYDTQRVVVARDISDKTFDVQITPQQAQAMQVRKDQSNKAIAWALNPQIGRYAVRSEVGPAYATRRQEAAQAMNALMVQNPEMAKVIGDLYLRNADFPGADEAADRLHRAVPPNLLGEGPPPEVQQLQQALQQTQQALKEALENLGVEKNRSRSKDQLRDIDVYEAETKRMAALAKVLPGVDPHGLFEILHQLVQDALATSLDPVRASVRAGLQDDIQGDPQARAPLQTPLAFGMGGVNGPQ